jgi:hypothetical protein
VALASAIVVAVGGGTSAAATETSGTPVGTTVASTPDTPRLLMASAGDFSDLVISGVVATSDSSPVDVRFYVSDASGNRLTEAAYITVRAASGTRPGVSIPEEMSKSRKQLTFQMQSCTVDGMSCSNLTDPVRVDSSGSRPKLMSSADTIDATKAKMLISAAETYLLARQSIEIGLSKNVDESLKGKVNGDATRSYLEAQAPILSQTGTTSRSYGSEIKRDPTISFKNEIVAADPDKSSVYVRLSADESFTSDGGEIGGVVTTFSHEVLLEFSATGGGSFILTRQFDALAFEGNPSTVDTTQISGSDSRGAEETLPPAANSLPQGVPVSTSAAGVATVSHVVPLQSAPSVRLVTAINRSNMVTWAYNNYTEAYQYTPNCTGWVSRAMYYGGGIPLVSPGLYTDDHYWWRQTLLGITTQTHSWAGAQNQANFLGYNSGSWVTNTTQAVPGDIIYYKYPGFSNINHTEIITTVNSTTGQIWMTQSNANYKNTSLADQQARITRDFGGNAIIYIRHVTM